MVTIAVIEGRYGKVALSNQTRLRDGVARGVLNGLDSGDLVANAPLQRRLLLLSDIPGVLVASTLSPGQAVGTSDLAIDLAPGPRISGSLEADNAGKPLHRRLPRRRHGQFQRSDRPRRRRQSAGPGPRTPASPTAGPPTRRRWASRPRASPTPICTTTSGASSRAWTPTATPKSRASTAAIRWCDRAGGNLYALANLDLKGFHDDVGLTSTTTRRQAQVLTLGLSGDHRDSFGGGGWSVYSISASVGNLDIQSPLDRAADAITARADGRYSKLQFSAARLQSLKGPLSLYGAVRGQVASTNLDTSEKMELGGAYAVRAYPEGEAYGDEGYVATVEARLQLTPNAARARAQLVGFVDAGAVRTAKSPLVPGLQPGASQRRRRRPQLRPAPGLDAQGLLRPPARRRPAHLDSRPRPTRLGPGRQALLMSAPRTPRLPPRRQGQPS